MRLYGYADWLHTVARTTNIDVPTLTLRYVDQPAALLALSATAGPEDVRDPKGQVADVLVRLMEHMLDLRPYRGVMPDRVVYATMLEYARRRGWDLSLGNQACILIEQVSTGEVGQDDARRAVFDALTLSSRPPREAAPGVTGCSAALCHPVTEAGVRGRVDMQAVSHLVERIAAWLTSSGVSVMRPMPALRTNAAGRRQAPHSGGPRLPTPSTREIFKSSVGRITGAHMVVIVNTGDPSGVHVEREWAFRLGLPIFEFLFDEASHPHQDGPGLVTAIEVSEGDVEAAVASFQSLVQELAWSIQDTKAFLDGVRIMDQPILEDSLAAWDSLSAKARGRVARATRMSRAYIEGNLSSPLGLNLFSDHQLAFLERMLQVYPQRLLQAVPKLSSRDLDRLTDAAVEAGLDPRDTVQAVVVATELYRRPAMRGSDIDMGDARRAIAQAVEVLRRGQ